MLGGTSTSGDVQEYHNGAWRSLSSVDLKDLFSFVDDRSFSNNINNSVKGFSRPLEFFSAYSRRKVDATDQGSDAANEGRWFSFIPVGDTIIEHFNTNTAVAISIGDTTGANVTAQFLSSPVLQGFTGLIAGRDYYIDASGGLTTHAAGNRFIGRAINAFTIVRIF